MLFDPHAQIQEESGVRLSQTNLTPRYGASNSLVLPSAKQEDWVSSVSTDSNSKPAINSPTNIQVSFDIYGNELPSNEDDIPRWQGSVEMDLESIEEEAASPSLGINQENNDPVLHMVTPLKKRNPDRISERRNSFAINRSPLLDITPAPKRKCSYHTDTRLSLTHLTPKNEDKASGGETSFMRRFR